MYLRPLTDRTSGTGTVSLKDSGASSVKVLISTNNSAAAVVVLRKGNSAGPVIFSMSTITAGDYPMQPVLVDGTTDVYYDISGTGATAQIFGCVL